jgi:hypothetical protein
MSGMGRALRVADYVDHMLEAVRLAPDLRYDAAGVLS